MRRNSELLDRQISFAICCGMRARHIAEALGVSASHAQWWLERTIENHGSGSVCPMAPLDGKTGGVL